MPRFEIESHRLSTRADSLDRGTAPSRLLELLGPDLGRGIRHRALITFSPGTAEPVAGSGIVGAGRGSGGAVGHLSQDLRGGITIVGWLPLDRLDDVLQLLEREAVLHYRLALGVVGRGYLDQLHLTAATSDPPVDQPRG